ncbi:MAG: S1C family serine protease [Fimbriimonadales bacterium]
MNNRWLPYSLMFLVCFGGVFAALALHDRLQGTSGAKSLSQFAEAMPVKYSKQPGEIAFGEATAKLIPAVVSVDVLQSSPFSDSPEMKGQGSGVIITSDGYIVTNNHVIAGGDEILVNLTNSKQFRATVVGSDRIADLALLKVNATNLPAVELGDSDDVQVGQWVLAVGNPLGYEGTLSVGVVSAVNRDLPGGPTSAPLVGAIQTDAAINQGNSGGALGNIHGQVIGINTVIATPNRGSVGIGFAIPSNRVRRAVDDIRKYGRVRHADLGIVRFAPTYVLGHPDFERQVGDSPPEYGLVVSDVVPESPVERAGIRKWDVVTEVNGKPVKGLSDYLTFLLKSEIGDRATIKYWSRGAMKSVSVVFAEVDR